MTGANDPVYDSRHGSTILSIPHSDNERATKSAEIATSAIFRRDEIFPVLFHPEGSQPIKPNHRFNLASVDPEVPVIP